MSGLVLLGGVVIAAGVFFFVPSAPVAQAGPACNAACDAWYWDYFQSECYPQYNSGGEGGGDDYRGCVSFLNSLDRACRRSCLKNALPVKYSPGPGFG